jgi:hypothetical protein
MKFKEKISIEEYDEFLNFYQHTLLENKGIRERMDGVNSATKGALINKG